MRLRKRISNGSSAQKCLNIDEIARVVVADLLERGLLGTAAALGTTCRSLFLTAIPELWRTLPSAVPLLLLVPRESINIAKATSIFLMSTKRRDDISDAQKPSLLAKIRQRLGRTTCPPNSWSRFELYSPFVRELGDAEVEDYICGYADFDILIALDAILTSRCAEHGSLTPRLTGLRWHLNRVSGDYRIPPNVSFFLAETLVHFEFDTHDTAIFKDIASFAPRLRHLAVMMPYRMEHDEEVLRAMSVVLFSARSLETLSWKTHLPWDWFLHISNIPGLRGLQLRLPPPGSQHSPTAGTPIHGAAFAALQVLALTSESVDDALDFLNFAHLAPLCSFMLVSTASDFWRWNHPIMFSRMQHHHGRTLAYIRIRLWWNSRSSVFDDSSSRLFLRDAPLISSSRMSSLGGSASCTSESTDSALRKMELDIKYIRVAELPLFLVPTLHELVINEMYHRFLPPSALGDLAYYCPQLRRLTLPLRFAPNLPWWHDTLRELPDLVYLNVVDSRIVDVHDVAHFLSTHCPRLVAVEWRISTSDANKAQWQEVNEILASWHTRT